MSLIPSRFPSAAQLQAAQSLAADTAEHPHALAARAWYLRQVDSVRAVDIARGLLSSTSAPATPSSGYPHLVLAEIAWLNSDLGHARQLLEHASTVFTQHACHPGLSDVEWVRSHLDNDLGAVADRDRAMHSSLHHAELAGDEQRIHSCRLALACFAVFDEDRFAADEQLSIVQPHTESSDPGLRFLAHTFFLHHYFSRQKPALAVEHGMLGREAALACGQTRRAIVDGSNIAHFLYEIHEIDGAVTQLQDALTLARRCGWPAPLANATSAMARCLIRLDRHAAALEAAQESVALASSLPGSRSHFMALNTLGDTHLALDQLDDAELAFSEMLRLCVPINDTHVLRYAHFGIANVHQRRGAHYDCYRSASRALVSAHAAGDLTLKVEAFRLMSKVACSIDPGTLIDGEPVQSQQSLLELAVITASNLSSIECHDELLLQLAHIREISGDLGSALRLSRQAYDALRSIRSKDLHNRAVSMEVRFRTEHAIMEARYQRQAAQTEIRRSADLQVLNDQLNTAMTELQRTQTLLVRRNEELTTAYTQINELSLTDPLTGLRNRRFFNQVIETCVSETLRSYSPSAFSALDANADDNRLDLVFFMIDIDHFKSVNDQFGHGAGDNLLVQLRDRLRTVARDEDVLVRWGGEEFLLALRATPRRNASTIASRLLYAVSATPFEVAPGIHLRKTCSVGYCAFPIDQANVRSLSWTDAIHLADQRLYAAKRSGRNRAVGPEQDQPAELLRA